MSGIPIDNLTAAAEELGSAAKAGFNYLIRDPAEDAIFGGYHCALQLAHVREYRGLSRACMSGFFGALAFIPVTRVGSFLGRGGLPLLTRLGETEAGRGIFARLAENESIPLLGGLAGPFSILRDGLPTLRRLIAEERGELSLEGLLSRRVAAATSEPALVDGVNGTLRDPITGRFAPNPNTAQRAARDGLHGNSLASPREAFLYRLEDQEGNYLKAGITSDPAGRYSQAFMADKNLELLTSGSRAQMSALERFIVMIDPGPLNFEPWAGTGLVP